MDELTFIPPQNRTIARRILTIIRAKDQEGYKNVFLGHQNFVKVTLGGFRFLFCSGHSVTAYSLSRGYEREIFQASLGRTPTSYNLDRESCWNDMLPMLDRELLLDDLAAL